MTIVLARAQEEEGENEGLIVIEESTIEEEFTEDVGIHREGKQSTTSTE